MYYFIVGVQTEHFDATVAPNIASAIAQFSQSLKISLSLDPTDNDRIHEFRIVESDRSDSWSQNAKFYYASSN
jgi:hypothetical protein